MDKMIQGSEEDWHISIIIINNIIISGSLFLHLTSHYFLAIESHFG